MNFTATWTASIETGDTAVAADVGATKTGTVTVSMGNTTGTFTVSTVEDTTVEVNETFTVTLSGVSSNAQLETDPTALSTDATLSDLSLGTGVTLSPAFASGTAIYTASVANSADEVTVTPTTNHASATVKYYDANDAEIADADTNAAGHQVALAVGTNTIVVVVTAEDGSTSQDFLVTVTRAAEMTSDDFTADTTTGQVDVGGSVTGNIESVGDADWFLVELEAGTRYQIDLEGAPTGRGTVSDPTINAVGDAGGNTITGTQNDDSGIGNNARTIFTATAGGDYVVSAAAYASTGTYTLSVIYLGANGASEADTDFPSNNTTTGRVEVGASVTGNMDRGSDFDWFRVDLEAGKTYQFDLEGSPTGRGSLGDPFLQIFDASGSNKLAEDDDSGGTDPNAQIVYTATATGTHYLTAQTLTTSTGTYTLSVRDITSATCTLNTGDVWCGVVTVAEIKTTDDALVGHGFVEAGGLSAGSLAGNPDDTMFSVGGNDYTIQGVYIQVPTADHLTGTLSVVLTADLTDDDKAGLLLPVDGTTTPFEFSDASKAGTTGQNS